MGREIANDGPPGWVAFFEAPAGLLSPCAGACCLAQVQVSLTSPFFGEDEEALTQPPIRSPGAGVLGISRGLLGGLKSIGRWGQ